MKCSWIGQGWLIVIAACGLVVTPALGQKTPPKEPPVKQPAGKPTPGEGEVIKVVGKDQVIVRTHDGKEMTVFISPETKFQLTEKGGQLQDLRPGAVIGFNYEVRDKRNMARQIVGVTRVEGKIVKVIGKDQVIIRTADGQEVIVYVSPETRYLLTDQPGQFIDLRPGIDIGVYYDVRDRRHMGRYFYGRRR